MRLITCLCSHVSTDKQAQQEAVDVYPEGGRLAMFYSADIPHEVNNLIFIHLLSWFMLPAAYCFTHYLRLPRFLQVLPTFGDRHAITLWYYDQNERAQAVMKAKEGGTASKVATASVQSQQLAKVIKKIGVC